MISRRVIGLLAWVGLAAAQYVNTTAPATPAAEVFGKNSPQPSPTPPDPSPNGPAPEWGCHPTKTVTKVETCYVTIDHTRPPTYTTIYITQTEDIYLVNTTTTTTTKIVPTTVVSTYTEVSSYPYTVVQDHTSFKYSTVTCYSTYTTNLTITEYETSTTTAISVSESDHFTTETKTDLSTTTTTSEELVPTTIFSTYVTTYTLNTSYPVTIDHTSISYVYSTYTTVTTVVQPVTYNYTATTTATEISVQPTTLISLITTSVPYTVDHSTTLYSTTVLTSTLVEISLFPTTVISLQSTTTTTVTTLFFTTLSIVPASTVTTTIQGTPITIIEPASTITVTSTTVSTQLVPTTLPGQITTLPGQITTIPGPLTTILGPTVTAPGKAVTKTITQAIVCPAPTKEANVVPQDTGLDALWGCSPGFVCFLPFPDDCNLWAEPPTYDYLCPAQYCKPAPDLHPVAWPEGKTDYFPPTDGYFNLNPNAFGLNYDIFVARIIVEWVTVSGTKRQSTRTFSEAWASQTSITHFPPTSTPKPKPKARDIFARALLKRDETIIPAVCYSTCNEGFLEATRVGKSPALCQSDSLFHQYLKLCDGCASANAGGAQDTLRVYADPQFVPFLGYCNQITVLPVLQSVTSTVVPEPETVVASTKTKATPIVTVTPQASASTNAPTVPISTEVPSSRAAVPTTTAPVPSGSPSATTSVPPQITAGSSGSPSAPLPVGWMVVALVVGAGGLL